MLAVVGDFDGVHGVTVDGFLIPSLPVADCG